MSEINVLYCCSCHERVADRADGFCSVCMDTYTDEFAFNYWVEENNAETVQRTEDESKEG